MENHDDDNSQQELDDKSFHTGIWPTIPLSEVNPDEDNLIFHGEHPAVLAALNYIIPDIKDSRLYVPWPERVSVKLKTDVSNEFCFQQFPGQNYYHHLLTGELYVQFNDSKFCLTCALQRGLITSNRLFWQRTGVPESIMTDDIGQEQFTDKTQIL